MAAIERDAIERALSQKGFTLETGKDHRYYRLYYGGKKTEIYTKVSLGKKYKTLADPLVSAMAGQMRLTGKQLHEFVACTLSAAGYIDALILRGAIKKPEPKADKKTDGGNNAPKK